MTKKCDANLVSPESEPPTSPALPRAGQETPVTDDRVVARGVAEALDRAIREGMVEQAQRMVSSAARFSSRCSRVNESLARLRYVQGNPEAALGIIDTANFKSSSLRLLRAICLMELGRKTEAHLDLLEWSHRSTAPLSARILLSLLEWECGDHDAAISVLGKNLRQIEDPTTLELALVLAIMRGRDDLADQCIERLNRFATYPTQRASLELLFVSLGRPRPTMSAEPPARDVATLATELAAAERLIPTLVAAQRRQTDHPSACLLIDALERALPELVDPATAIAGLARVCHLIGRPEESQRWIALGLQQYPMATIMVQVGRELEDHGRPSAAPSSGAPTSDVLAILSPSQESESSHQSQDQAA